MNQNVRNFVIIAHIDHGKSTLADRFLELTKTVDYRQMKPQYLDQLELERERGITIKMAPVRMRYKYADEDYVLNLIDTPGHSDFSYEVSRALASVEGAILLVDVTQGIQAQTLVNFRLAKSSNLKIIGAVNKIDIQNLDSEAIEKITKEVAGLIGVAEEEIFKISGKTGEGVPKLLEAIIQQVPPPKNSIGSSNQALIFDSLYDDHKGVVAFVRVFSGEYKDGFETELIATGQNFKIKEVGYFLPKISKGEILKNGEIGYIATGLKDPEKLKIGDTIGDKALLGYMEPKPVIFVSLYPDESDQYDDFKYALLKLKLNDSSLSFEPDFNEVLGRGFKCGFLGQLHFEITAERLAKEFNLKTISTFPFVAYKIKDKSGFYFIKNIEDLPSDFYEIWEPTIKISIVSPINYLGRILKLKEFFRIKGITTNNLSLRPKPESETSSNEENKVLIAATMPLSSLLSDFDGQLKSISEGMASMSYELGEYEKADLEKVEILVVGERVPGLSRLMYRNEVEHESREMLLRLKEILPKQQFSQSLQVKAGGRIIARENIPALRKDVTGYLYGGDRTRKMKLWKKQKKGKKRLKETGRVAIQANDFKKLLKK